MCVKCARKNFGGKSGAFFVGWVKTIIRVMNAEYSLGNCVFKCVLDLDVNSIFLTSTFGFNNEWSRFQWTKTNRWNKKIFFEKLTRLIVEDLIKIVLKQQNTKPM